MIRGLSNANLINSAAQIFPLNRLRLRLIRLVSVAVLFFQAACTNTELKEPLVYTGPLRKAENIELYYSEKDQVKVKMVAAEMLEFESGDREFPKGIYMEFYEESGRMERTLRANHAYFFKKENQWRGRGKVEVKNISTNEQLNTEELFWKPGEERIFTEKFVTIRQQGDVIYGQGLEAKQDLSDYVIKEVKGDFEVKEE